MSPLEFLQRRFDEIGHVTAGSGVTITFAEYTETLQKFSTIRQLVDRLEGELAKTDNELAAAQAEARALLERAEKAERNYQWMVERAADQHLSGYRELARRAADAENVADGLRAELARVREIVSGMREYADSCDHPNAVEYWLTQLEEALSQPAGQHDPLAVSDHCGECGEPEPECACDERESLPLMARREWMLKGAQYAYRDRDSAWFQSVDKPGRAWEFCYRIADTDEHGLPVVERTADIPEDVTHMTLHTRRFFRAGELRARSVEGDEGLLRIEDYRPAAQESGDAD